MQDNNQAENIELVLPDEEQEIQTIHSNMEDAQ